jgi:hypothetical protein
VQPSTSGAGSRGSRGTRQQQSFKDNPTIDVQVTRISSARSASSSSLPKGKLLPHIFSFDR